MRKPPKVNGSDMLMLLAGIILGWAIFSVIAQNRFMPTAYISTSTGECVRVEAHGEDIDCDNLPDRYRHVFVE